MLWVSSTAPDVRVPVSLRGSAAAKQPAGVFEPGLIDPELRSKPEVRRPRGQRPPRQLCPAAQVAARLAGIDDLLDFEVLRRAQGRP